MKKFLLGLTLVFSMSVGGVSVAQTELEEADDGQNGGGMSQCYICMQQNGTCSTYYASELDCYGSFYTNCCKGG